MRPNGSPALLEARRRSIVAFLRRGLSLHEIARRVGCNASSVLRWRNAWRSGGGDALKAKPASGRPPRLSGAQKSRLVSLLAAGATSQGYRTELWTTLRVAEVIERRLHVRYHRNHVGKLLHQLGWSHQKPELRAIERNEDAVESWKRDVWPRVKKTPRGWMPTSSLPTNPASC